MTRIKICGLASEADARYAAACGAQFLGLVLAESPRRADVAEVADWLPAIRRKFPAVCVVGVFVRPSNAEVSEAVHRLDLDFVQVHGVENAEALALPRPLVLAAGPESLTRAAAARPWAVLADRMGPTGAGGTGTPLDWAGLVSVLPAELQRGEASKGSIDDVAVARVADPGARCDLEGAPGSPRLFLAGGLEAGNVAEAIRIVRPWAVDASSRLEFAPGRKDPAKVAAFCEAVRVADCAGTRRSP